MSMRRSGKSNPRAYRDEEMGMQGKSELMVGPSRRFFELFWFPSLQNPFKLSQFERN